MKRSIRQATLPLTLGTALCAAGLAGAQSSRDELVAAGAKALTAAELGQALSGAEISGPSYRGNLLRLQVKTNGSISGNYYVDEGFTVFASGKWNINEQGQFCFQVAIFGGARDAACEDWFKSGGDYYAIRDGRVLKRSVAGR